ncbi:MAG: hypothetical protein AAF721_19890, partial [Myxococcota bacterium]
APSPAPTPAEPGSASAPETDTPVSAAAPTNAEPPTESAESTPTCDAAPAWRYERIELPPPFAPSLPAGVEVLWFAPGMFEPAATDYFTYSFSLRWAGAGLGDTPLPDALHAYYDGLMRAVAGSRDAEPRAPVVVALAEDGRSGTVTLSDEFTGGETITVHLRVGGDASCMRLYATAKPTEAIWARLAATDACLCGGAS